VSAQQAGIRMKYHVLVLWGRKAACSADGRLAALGHLVSEFRAGFGAVKAEGAAKAW